MKPNINKWDVQRLWDTAEKFPAGKWVFSKCLGVVVPYSGSISPKVVVLKNGHCIISMKKQRKVCNHIGIVHGAAIGNLAELTAGLAMVSKIEKPNCIVAKYSVNLIKPVETDVIAHCILDEKPLESVVRGDVSVLNSSNIIVATANVVWRVWK